MVEGTAVGTEEGTEDRDQEDRVLGDSKDQGAVQEGSKGLAVVQEGSKGQEEDKEMVQEADKEDMAEDIAAAVAAVVVVAANKGVVDTNRTTFYL